MQEGTGTTAEVIQLKPPGARIPNPSATPQAHPAVRWFEGFGKIVIPICAVITVVILVNNNWSKWFPPPASPAAPTSGQAAPPQVPGPAPASPSPQETMAAAETAENAGDHAKAFQLFTAAYYGGVNAAAGRLGELLESGSAEGRKDILAAVAWYKRGVAGGDHFSAYRLGMIYLASDEVTREDACLLLEQAAAYRYADADAVAQKYCSAPKPDVRPSIAARNRAAGWKLLPPTIDASELPPT